MPRLNQDFYFVFLVASDYTSDHLGWSRCFIPSITGDSGGQGRGQFCAPGYGRNGRGSMIKRFLIRLSLPVFL